jgi:hypothetical protein
MHYCLAKSELDMLMAFHIDGKQPTNEELQAHFDNSSNWIEELSALTYFFSQIIQKRSKNGERCEDLTRQLYSLQDQIYLHIQEIDYKFIDCMLHTLPEKTLTLEQNLVQVQNRVADHKYDETLRY